jgi:hypothetical protein
LLVVVQLLAGALDMLRRSPMAQVVVELVVLKLATREAWASLAEIARRLEHADPTGPGRSGPAHPAPAAPRPTAAPEPARPRSEAAGAPRGVMASPRASSDLPAPVVLPEPPADIAAMWPRFMERVAAQKMSLAAYLAHARPMGREGNALTIGIPNVALHHEVLSLTDHRRLIERTLSELCGGSVTVQYLTLEDEAPAAPVAAVQEAAATAPPIVQDIVNLFNATLVDKPRTT